MASMKLLYQTHSPYARKVLVAAYEMELHEAVAVIHHETSPTRRNAEVFALNPLGKVPVLICDDGTVLFDSNVICEYLDGLHPGPRLLPSQPSLRFRALKMQALAQGIADAGIAARWERERRPTELRWPTMHDGQIQKIAAACDFLEQELDARTTAASATNTASSATTTGPSATTTGPSATTAARSATTAARSATTAAVAADDGRSAEATPANRRPDIGDIALATALSWVEFRRVYDFLTGRPSVARWYARISARPSMLATTLQGQTHD
jgi:glutathione S-transferase